jgi:hypothetical protein
MPSSAAAARSVAACCFDGLDLVPAGVMEPPSTEYCRQIWKPECAMLLDGYLRRLSRQKALVRLVLGRLAARLRSRRDYRRLGFVRIGDYAGERLGISKREIESLAQVAVALEKLQATTRAFEVGQVCWAKLRLIASIATASDEQAWLERARCMTAAELQKIVAATRAADAPAAGAVAAGAGVAAGGIEEDDDDDSIDGEPRIEVNVRCPARLRVLWREALHLARCAAGSEIAQWQAAEVIAAEGLSAAEARDPACAGEAAGAAGSPRACDIRLTRIDRPHDDSRDNGRMPDGRPWDDWESLDALRAALDWSAVEEAIPDRIERLAEDLDMLSPHEVDARLREALEAGQRIDWQLGRLLHTMFRMRLYRELGFHDSGAYIRERLGISVRKARALVKIEKHCGYSTYALSEAFGRGEISWLRALVLLPVLSEQHGDAWIERARRVTLRRLVDEVEWASNLRDCVRGSLAVAPPPLGCRLGPEVGMVEVRGEDGQIEKVQIGAPLAPRGLCREKEPWVDCDACIRFSAPASVVDLLTDAVRAFARPGEAPWRGLERLLVEVVGYWKSLPRHRDPIFARDGWLCGVPGCSGRRDLHDHHIAFRSLGGDNDQDNRKAVCAPHHQYGIHGGVIRARGRVSTGVTWELGVRRGGTPLLIVRDEVYVNRGC